MVNHFTLYFSPIEDPLHYGENLATFKRKLTLYFLYKE